MITTNLVRFKFEIFKWLYSTTEVTKHIAVRRKCLYFGELFEISLVVKGSDLEIKCEG